MPIAQQLYPFELPYVVRIFSATFPCGDKTLPVFTFRHVPYPQEEDVEMKLAIEREGQGESTSMKKFDRVMFEVT